MVIAVKLLLGKLFKRKTAKDKSKLPNLESILSLVHKAANDDTLFSVRTSIDDCMSYSKWAAHMPTSERKFTNHSLTIYTRIHIVNIIINTAQPINISCRYNQMVDSDGEFRSDCHEGSIYTPDSNLIRDIFLKVEDYFGKSLGIEIWDALENWTDV